MNTLVKGRLCNVGWLLAMLFLATSSAGLQSAFGDPPSAAPESKLGEAKQPAATEKSKSTFVRVRRDEKKVPLTLETAITNYRRDGADETARVDLIGAIHVADKSYYEALNERFKEYDAVLYELVAPEDANVPKPGATPGSAVGGVQVGMTAMLELAFQLDHIDYKAENMVHADMSPEEFEASMKKRNESFIGMFARLMGRGFAEQAKDPVASSDFAILAAMFAEDRPFQLKRIMADQFAANDDVLESISGPQGSTIVTERNKKALEVLKRELAAGKKKIAIFYGAAHMADFEKRLIADFNLKRGETTWLAAWSLVKAKPAKKKKAD